MPSLVQSAAKLPVHSCAAGTKLSLMTVDSMFAGVTHSGVSRTDGDGRRSPSCPGSCRWPGSSGGVLPARRYMASAAAAWASR